ncbi:hypothetical protein IWQ62_006000 [Dispira parvispora]|uniref:Uncharacterized protein n=1 Tax=Dispira parvispora TaxID=1520584 RepID=A0A9W8E0H7_9FUNG|nr:hypothetical protein IWQ62_006000 [Dispira parvispora]
MLSKYLRSPRSSSTSLVSSNVTFVEKQTVDHSLTTTKNCDALTHDLESDMSALQRHLERPGLQGLSNQRVQLTEDQQSRLAFAKLVTTVKRLGRGRMVGQEAAYHSPDERRSQEILSFMDRMDRFNVPQLSDRQRFVRRPVPAL